MANFGEPPTFVRPISHARALARLAMSLRPAFVFGMEVFQYGLATSMCRGIPRVLMPWGGDIYLYPEASAVSFAMVRRALSRVELICPTSGTAVAHIIKRYGIQADRIHAISWGVDRTVFRPAGPARRTAVCSRFGIDPEARVILNVRRFLPIWGCLTALEACMVHASVDPHAHYVFLGGAGTEEGVREARHRIRTNGLERRFTLFEGDTPYSDCVDLMSIADVFLSLMLVPDMRSFSILQAAASGAVPVLSDQPEYREMGANGFHARYVDPRDSRSVADALTECASDTEYAKRVRLENGRYIARHEDQNLQMARLLEAIRNIPGGRRL